jgi:acetylornithine deacetylase
MATLVLAFEREYCANLSASHPLTGDAVCSINTITGGVAVNIIPDLCEVELDRRTIPGEDSDDVLREISQTFAAIAEKNPTIDFEMLDPFVDPVLDPHVNAKISGRLSEILQSCGVSGEPEGAGYGTDASTYSAVGIPAIVIGPGSIEQAHTEDEWLEIAQLEKSVEIYCAIMRSDF